MRTFVAIFVLVAILGVLVNTGEAFDEMAPHFLVLGAPEKVAMGKETKPSESDSGDMPEDKPPKGQPAGGQSTGGHSTGGPPAGGPPPPPASKVNKPESN